MRVLSVLLLLPTTSFAQPDYLSRVPNTGVQSCNTCHTAGGGSPRNPFGLDFQAGGFTWDGVFAGDSDGDGCSNGQELGDEAGDWMAGAPDPTYVSDPANDADNDCGPTPDPEPTPDPDPEPTPDPDPEPTPDPDPGTEEPITPEIPTEEGGCQVAPAPAAGLLMVAGLLGLRRRR